MPTTNIATQPVHAYRKSDGQFLYDGTSDRDVVQYPLTDAGQAAYEAALAAGSHTGITVSNGAVIPAGSIPPLTMPTILLAPTGLTATAASSSQINLAWTAVSGATGYQVEQSANGTSGWTLVGNPTEAAFAKLALVASTQYYYRVRAVQGSSLSAYSSIVNATTSTASYAAYSKKLQAEDSTSSNISYSGGYGDGVTRAFGSNASHYIEWANIPDAPVTDANYSILIRYQTTSDTDNSVITLKLNGTAYTVTLPHTNGVITSLVLSGRALNAGTNTIRIEGSSGNFGIDYITISHAASS
ncbi:fibronectin type III domain-containing protein [Spirosoma litoris]